MYRFITLALAALVFTLTLGFSTDSQALPRDRAAGRQAARASRQTGRQVSRSRWRGCHVLPHGAVAFRYASFTYYRVGPRFYYPYIYGGRTVYIDIDVKNGNPVPPPAAGSIDIDIDID